MSINLTLIGQMITFILFIAFTQRFVWPHIMNALNERQEKIADGLAAAERSQRELELAQRKSAELLREAKVQAADIIDKANHRGTQLVEEAKGKAREEGKRLFALAQAEISQEVSSAKQALMRQVATVAISGAEKILGKQIDAAANNELMNQLIEEI